MNNRVDSESSFRPRPPGQRRVLVVDNDLDGVQTLVILLWRMGHDVALALNCEQAVYTARHFVPEFVFLDLAVPDGYEVARRLRREPCLEGARIFALTGNGQPSDRSLLRQTGCELHLVKPVDAPFLASLLGQGVPLKPG